jgi:hypothetical protein
MGMKKNNPSKRTLSLSTQTIRALRSADLGGAAGGYLSIPCGTRGCSAASCAVSCAATQCDCVTYDRGCPQ